MTPRYVDEHFGPAPEGPLNRTPRAKNEAEASFLAIGEGGELWLTEAAAVGTSRVRVKMAEAITLSALHGASVVDRALGPAAVTGRWERATSPPSSPTSPRTHLELCHRPRVSSPRERHLCLGGLRTMSAHLHDEKFPEQVVIDGYVLKDACWLLDAVEEFPAWCCQCCRRAHQVRRQPSLA